MKPAAPVRRRFPDATVEALLALGIYRWEREKFDALRSFLCADDLDALVRAATDHDAGKA